MTMPRRTCPRPKFKVEKIGPFEYLPGFGSVHVHPSEVGKYVALNESGHRICVQPTKAGALRCAIKWWERDRGAVCGFGFGAGARPRRRGQRRR